MADKKASRSKTQHLGSPEASNQERESDPVGSDRVLEKEGKAASGGDRSPPTSATTATATATGLASRTKRNRDFKRKPGVCNCLLPVPLLPKDVLDWCRQHQQLLSPGPTVLDQQTTSDGDAAVQKRSPDRRGDATTAKQHQPLKRGGSGSLVRLQLESFGRFHVEHLHRAAVDWLHNGNHHTDCEEYACY